MNVLLVDDHQMMRDGLRAVLEREADIHVVGEASDGRAALELCATLRPDVVVMDIGMPGLTGIEATRLMAQRHAGARVVGLSMNNDRRYVHAMFEAGAWGFLVKSCASDELIRALRAVASGEKYVSPAVASSVLESFLHGSRPPAEDPRDALSPRECEVLQLIAEGLTSKEVAVRLDVAASTVETHRKQIMAKLGLHSVAELTKFAVRSGLTTLE